MWWFQQAHFARPLVNTLGTGVQQTLVKFTDDRKYRHGNSIRSEQLVAMELVWDLYWAVGRELDSVINLGIEAKLSGEGRAVELFGN